MHRATEHGTEFQGYSRIHESEGTESKGVHTCYTCSYEAQKAHASHSLIYIEWFCSVWWCRCRCTLVGVLLHGGVVTFRWC